MSAPPKFALPGIGNHPTLKHNDLNRKASYLTAPPPPDDDDDGPPPDDDDDLPPPDDDDDLPPPDDEDDDLPPPDDDDEPPPDDDDEPPPDDDDDDEPPPDDDDDLPPDDDDDLPPPDDDDDLPPSDDDSPPPPPAPKRATAVPPRGPPPPDDDDDDGPPDDDAPPSPPGSPSPPDDDDDGPPPGDEDEEDLPPPPPAVSAASAKAVKPTKSSAAGRLPVAIPSKMKGDAKSSSKQPQTVPSLESALSTLTAGLNVSKPATSAVPTTANTPAFSGSKIGIAARASIIRPPSPSPPGSPNSSPPPSPPGSPPPPDSDISADDIESVAMSLAAVEKKALGEGFVMVVGKFDGDPFERLYLKIDKKTNKMLIRIESGEEVEFDMSTGMFVCEDPQDTTCIVVEYRATIIVFKFENAHVLQSILGQMPQSVFDIQESDFSTVASIKSEKSKSKGKAPEGHVVVKENRRRSKVGSVEDLLEGASTKPTPSFGAPPLSPPPPDLDDIAPPPADIVKGHRRKELIDDRIRKPKYSVRRVKQICRWINGLKIWDKPIDIPSLHKEMCSGLLLAKLMQVLIPSANFINLNQKARSKRAAIENLEQALGLIWRSKACNTSRIPKSTDIYDGSTASIAVLLQELFEVYVVKPLYKNAIKMLRWYQNILRQYQLNLPDEVFDEGDLQSVWPFFQSGTAIFCVIYHLHGPITLGEGVGQVALDPMRVIFSPQNIHEFRANLSYTFALLRALKIEIIWDVDDWLTSADTEFMILQLSYIFEQLKTRQCSLPPAQGHSAGVTSGRNGQPLVVGMVFADTKPTTIAALQRSRRVMLIGSGENSLPLLPVDSSGPQGRFISNTIPVGLMSTEAKITRAPIEVKGLCQRSSSNRKDWNSSALSVQKEEQLMGKSTVLTILRGVTDNKSGPSGTIAVGQTAQLRAEVITGIEESMSQFPVLMSNHINVAVEQLESDMKSADLEMEEREDVLAARYLDLEASVADIPVELYERSLEMLEAERKRLEEDRVQLQEHFALRLSSIKSQHQEAAMRSEALMLEKSRSKLFETSLSSPSQSPRKKALSTSFALDPANLAKAEKGWISSAIKTNSHNAHLSKLQKKSAEALLSVWEPPKLKAKAAEEQIKSRAQGLARQTVSSNTPGTYSAQSQSNYSFGGGDALSYHDLTNGNVSSAESGYFEAKDELHQPGNSAAAVFSRFKVKLNDLSVRWHQSKRLAPITKMETPKQHDQPPRDNSRPTIQMNSAAVNSEKARRAGIIRDEERKLMQYEDERRKRYLKLVKTATISTPGTKPLQVQTTNSPSRVNSDGPNTPGQRGSGSEGNAFTDLDVQAAALWWSGLRPLTLGGRTRREYLWKVAAEYSLPNVGGPSSSSSVASGNNSVSNASGNQVPKRSFVLQWFDPQQQQVPLGTIVLHEVRDIAISGEAASTLALLIGESAKAIRGTGGRTTVLIECSSQGEAIKYQNTLQTLRMASEA